MHFFPWTKQSYSYIRNNFPWKELRTSWTAPPQQKIKGLYQDRQERHTCNLIKTHTSHGEPQTRGVLQTPNFSLKSEGSVLKIRHPNPWDLHWRDEPPKCLILKIHGLASKRTRVIWNRDSALKGFICRITHPGTQCKSNNLKSLDHMWRKFTRRQKPIGTLSRNRNNGGHLFLHFPTTFLAPRLVGTIFALWL